MAQGAQKPVEVGMDYILAPKKEMYGARVYVPKGEPPEEGWPLFVWYHGGGWVTGNLNSDEGFLTHLCCCMPSPSLFAL